MGTFSELETAALDATAFIMKRSKTIMNAIARLEFRSCEGLERSKINPKTMTPNNRELFIEISGTDSSCIAVPPTQIMVPTKVALPTKLLFHTLSRRIGIAITIATMLLSAYEIAADV